MDAHVTEPSDGVLDRVSDTSLRNNTTPYTQAVYVTGQQVTRKHAMAAPTDDGMHELAGSNVSEDTGGGASSKVNGKR